MIYRYSEKIMRFLTGREHAQAEEFMLHAKTLAKNSYCLRNTCGSCIVQNHTIIWEGRNSPPGNKRIETCIKDLLPANFKSDKTCCIHAEERAIMDALKNNPDKISWSRLYFIRVDLEGKIMYAGKPFCTICSKMALDAGIAEFILRHEEGICAYKTDEYNTLSFNYRP